MSNKSTANEELPQPEPEWDELHNVPRCATENCRHYDGKRCALMGFEPDGICEPQVQIMGEYIGVVLANPNYSKKMREEYLLAAIQLTKKELALTYLGQHGNEIAIDDRWTDQMVDQKTRQNSGRRLVA